MENKSHLPLPLLVLGRMQLTLHDSPNTSRRFALGANNACRVGETPTCSVPALRGCEVLWSYDHGHAWLEYSHTPRARFPPLYITNRPPART